MVKTEGDPLGFAVSLSLRPLKAKIGSEILLGKDKATMIRNMARQEPNGTHMNMARVESGVGLRANLPSWKMRGLVYLSLGRWCQLVLSASLIK